MTVISEMPWLFHPSVLLLCIVLLLLYKYSTRNFNYWQKLGVPFQKPLPLFGNFAEAILLKRSPSEWLKSLYDNTDKPILGIYILDDPYLVINDPDLIHRVLVKDFQYFSNRMIAAPEHDELTANLPFFHKGPEWRARRAKLSTIFTSGKVKGMYPTFNECAKDLIHYLIDQTGAIETKELVAKYAIDIIGKCFFGIDVGSFRGNPEFSKYGGEVFKFNLRNTVVQSIFLFKPSWVNTLKLQFFKEDVKKYFLDVFSQAMNYRKKSSAKVGDIIDLLNDMVEKRESFGDEGPDNEKILSPAMQMFIAGFETTSTAVSFTLLELSVNMDIQNKLREEIETMIVKYQGVTYEAVQEMKYLDMCVKESLRKYPPVGFLDRICNQDYKVPGTDVIIEKGISIFVPSFGLHYDEKYFPEPHKFFPERFSMKDGNKNVLLPFGKGPRFCIGERFGKHVTKLALIHIIANFEVLQCENTPYPVVFDPKSWLPHSKGGLPLKFRKLSKCN